MPAAEDSSSSEDLSRFRSIAVSWDKESRAAQQTVPGRHNCQAQEPPVGNQRGAAASGGDSLPAEFQDQIYAALTTRVRGSIKLCKHRKRKPHAAIPSNHDLSDVRLYKSVPAGAAFQLERKEAPQTLHQPNDTHAASSSDSEANPKTEKFAAIAVEGSAIKEQAARSAARAEQQIVAAEILSSDDDAVREEQKTVGLTRKRKNKQH